MIFRITSMNVTSQSLIGCCHSLSSVCRMLPQWKSISCREIWVSPSKISLITSIKCLVSSPTLRRGRGCPNSKLNWGRIIVSLRSHCRRFLRSGASLRRARRCSLLEWAQPQSQLPSSSTLLHKLQPAVSREVPLRSILRKPGTLDQGTQPTS